MTAPSCDYGSWSRTPIAYDVEKDPDETIDFEFNWKAFLGSDTISASTFVLPDGLTSVSTSNTPKTATIFVSGGTACASYRITNRITTVGGRTKDKTIRVRVRDL